MAYRRPIMTDDIGRFMFDLIKHHDHSAAMCDADAYHSQDHGAVVCKRIDVRARRDDLSNLVIETDRGELFCITVTRIG